MTHLYEITEDFLHITNLIEAGEIPQDQATDLIDQMSGELKAKAHNVAAYIGNQEAMITAMKDAEKKIATRRKSIESNITWLKDYLKSNMERSGITKIEHPEFVLSIAKNPPKVVIDGEVPAEFKVEKVTLSDDKKAIKAAIESGDCDFAHLEQSTRLAIK